MLSSPAVAVGITASGITSGLTLAYPLLINHTFLLKEQGSKFKPISITANLNIAQRLTLWNRAYDVGHWCPMLAIVAAAGFSFSALTSSKVLIQRLLVGATSLHLSIIPFTVFVIKPVNDRLMALRKAANEDREVPIGEAEALFSKWNTLHNVRVLLTFAGFVTAVASTLQVVSS